MFESSFSLIIAGVRPSSEDSVLSYWSKTRYIALPGIIVGERRKSTARLNLLGELLVTSGIDSSELQRISFGFLLFCLAHLRAWAKVFRSTAFFLPNRLPFFSACLTFWRAIISCSFASYRYRSRLSLSSWSFFLAASISLRTTDKRVNIRSSFASKHRSNNFFLRRLASSFGVMYCSLGLKYRRKLSSQSVRLIRSRSLTPDF